MQGGVSASQKPSKHREWNPVPTRHFVCPVVAVWLELGQECCRKRIDWTSSEAMARSLGQWSALKITTVWVLLGLSLFLVGLLTGLLGIVMKNTANSPLQIGALLMVCFGCVTTCAALAETLPACCRDEGGESGTSADESGTSAPEARRLRWATCTFRNLTAEVAEFHEVLLRGHEDQKRLEGSTLVLPPTKVRQDTGCACCLEEFLPTSRVVVLQCGHVYHKECISRWLLSPSAAAGMCPVCRVCLEFARDANIP